MFCPVCLKVISAKRKKQIKHLYNHSANSVIYALLRVSTDLATCRRDASERQDQPGAVFSLVEEDNEEDSADIPSDLETYLSELYPFADPVVPLAAPVDRCGYCNAVITPDNYNKHGYDCPLAPAAVEQPADTGEYAEVKYIRIAADGPEFQLLNALTRYSHYAQDHYNTSAAPSLPFLDMVYFRANAGKEYYLPADGVEADVLNALAWYMVRSMGK